MNIRPLQESDVSQVEAIFDMYWHDSFRQSLADKIQLHFGGQDFKFFVAVEDEEVIGVAGIRKAPERMMHFAKTTNPAEFYMMAVKERGKGVGKQMAIHILEELKSSGYTEALFFSGESHKETWAFYDKYAERVGEDVAPNGERGFVWRKEII